MAGIIASAQNPIFSTQPVAPPQLADSTPVDSQNPAAAPSWKGLLDQTNAYASKYGGRQMTDPSALGYQNINNEWVAGNNSPAAGSTMKDGRWYAPENPSYGITDGASMPGVAPITGGGLPPIQMRNATPTDYRALSNMQGDWKKTFDPSNNQAVSYGGGTVSAVDANGGRTYTDASGKATTLNAQTNMDDFAKNNPEVAQLWGHQYGYQAPTGIIKSAMGSATPLGQNSATGSGAAQLGPTTQWGVTAPQTVAGQLHTLTAGDSPLMQQARTSANEQMATRGLSNSSMAVSAADQAAYAAALPIAQSDAALNAKSVSYNADTANQFAVQNLNAQNTWAGQNLSASVQNHATDVGAATSLSNAATSAATQNHATDTSAATQTHQIDTTAATAISNANLDAATKLQLQNLDATTRTQLATLSNNNSQLLQTNQSAQSAFNVYMNTIANISASTTMDAAAKQTAMDQANRNINQQFQAIGHISNADISQYFVPTPVAPVLPGSAAAAPAPTSNLVAQQNERANENQYGYG